MQNPNPVFLLKLMILPIILLVPVAASAQKEYKLSFQVNGLKDTTALLGYYFGETTYKKDTAVVDGAGYFVFAGQEELPQGIYFIALSKTRIFEFVVGENQQFSLKTDTADYIGRMKVSGDKDNELFFENMILNIETHKKAQPFVTILQDSARTKEEKDHAKQELDRINTKVLDYHESIIAKYPNTVTSDIFRATQRVNIPEPPKRADGSVDSTFQLRWYRQHFFDHFDLADDVLLRMPRPFYKEKITEYLDRLYVPDPDTVITAIDFMVSKAKQNPETYKYLIYQCILKYQNPEVMGLDEVFVYLNDRYFETGEMDYWANDKFKKNIKDYADRLRKSLIGNKAANLIMQDLDRKPRSMYDIGNQYTILYFFDPDCGHCKTETPKLVDFYKRNKTRFDVEVYAVSADSSMQAMRDYVKDMNMQWITVNGPRTYVGPYQNLYDALTTPTLYVLDENKKIIAKRIPIEKLEAFLDNRERKSSGEAASKQP